MLYTVKDAAKVLHTSCSKIRRLVDAGTLAGNKANEGSPIMIESSTMADYVLDHLDEYADEILGVLDKNNDHVEAAKTP